MTNKTLHALMVGINAYPKYALKGCVPDTLAVGAFLQKHCADNDLGWNPRYLLAPNYEDRTYIEQARSNKQIGLDNYQVPTRSQVVQAFGHLSSDQIGPEDICLFYFSGHGSQQVSTEEFRHLKPDGMNESIVCVDSRTDSRDLLDKELAYLLSTVTRRNPNVHLLVIMDCCNSGNGTRGDFDNILVRHQAPSYDPVPFEELLGIKDVPEPERVFELSDDKAFYRNEARHIHLAAARDSELAKELPFEGISRGVFTHSLLRVLEQGGVALTYPEIAARVGALVRSRVSNQIPQLDAWGQADRQAVFLNGAATYTSRSYPVVFENNEWRLKAGELLGIVQGTNTFPTTVRLNDRTFGIKEVLPHHSIIDIEEGAFAMDPDEELILGEIEQMAVPRISIFPDLEGSTGRGSYFDELKNIQTVYCGFDASSAAQADYVARQDEKGNFMLLKNDSNYPVFLRQPILSNFVNFCNSVGKWHYVNKMDKPLFEGLSMEDIDITLEVLDDINPGSINTAKGKTLAKGEPVVLHYEYNANGVEGVPALRCTVRLNKNNFYLGGLYVDNEFGISINMPARKNTIGEVHYFEYQQDGSTYNALPLYIKEELIDRGVFEIEESLKLFISTDPFDLNEFEQQSLPLDTVRETDRSGFGNKSAPAKPGWCVITIPVKIVCKGRPMPLNALTGMGIASITGLPDNFSAMASYSSLAEARRLVEGVKSGTRGSTAALEKYVFPPASIWGENATEGQVFSRSVEMQYDAVVSILELTQVEGQIEEPIELVLEEKAAEDEVIVPYGYDEESELFLPMGFTTTDGDVHVYCLPDETPGLLTDLSADYQTRSVGRSIKLFFKKLRRGKLPNTLALVDESGKAEADVDKIKPIVSEATSILLVTHGIFGKSEDKIFEFNRAPYRQQFDVILTYDYENLNTVLEKTAEDLLDQLTKAGAFIPEKGARLTIVAPSMGGLVSRYMIEQLDGDQYVKHLMMVAVPNLGTDLSTFRKSIFGLLGRALNGVALLKPYIIPLSFVAKRIDKEIWKTLNQMEPGKSKFLTGMIASKRPEHVRYSLLGGNAKGIELLRDKESGNFWNRFKKFVAKKLLDWFVFDENDHDWAVEVSSQKGQADLIEAQSIKIIATDHISYFVEDEAKSALATFLIEDQV